MQKCKIKENEKQGKIAKKKLRFLSLFHLLILFVIDYCCCFEMDEHDECYSKGSCKCDTLAWSSLFEWVMVIHHLLLDHQQRKYDIFWYPLHPHWHCKRLVHPLKHLSNIHSLWLYFLPLCWKSNEYCPHLKVFYL